MCGRNVGFKFIDFDLTDDDTCRATIRMFLQCNLVQQFHIPYEILGLLVACLCHDLDHRGTNNAFQTKTESPLAILYTTSTMEHHHFDQCVMILNSDGNNIFQAMMDRERKDELPKMQVGFIDLICLPLYKVPPIYYVSLFLHSLLDLKLAMMLTH
ncbi:unnamed protein product [Bemisia tabaci]|uniref:PDEase domain-containing protein n=1 Tax=Bemisia tabaci TaxID=7038 RepID=A0A9P0FAE2_BEMTA|nr:unnamed protein product [Bemisia tabaci]